MVDLNAINMRFKAWPMYKDWNEVFGMDRVNGRVAEDVVQAVNGLHKEDDQEVDEQNLAPNSTSANMDFVSEAPAVEKLSTITLSGKKRSASDASTSDRLCDILGQYCKSSDNHMESLVRVLGHGADIGNA
ncbi:hypothetical protein ACS0TY_004939 [Phlomoides rotata]